MPEELTHDPCATLRLLIGAGAWLATLLILALITALQERRR